MANKTIESLGDFLKQCRNVIFKIQSLHEKEKSAQYLFGTLLLKFIVVMSYYYGNTEVHCLCITALHVSNDLFVHVFPSKQLAKSLRPSEIDIIPLLYWLRINF